MAKSTVLTEDVINQSIVVADGLDRLFLPLSQSLPKALYPVCNRPLIDYVLEFLRNNGVQEVILILQCCHTDILEHLRQTGWMSQSLVGFRVIPVYSPEFRSLGDALREIADRCLIRFDFVLVSVDVISNADLRTIRDMHIDLRQNRDKNCILTTVMQPCRRQEDLDAYCVAVVADTGRIMSYSPLLDLRHVDLTEDMLKSIKDGNVNIYTKLRSCGVHICSPKFIGLFRDEFDYQTVDDFIRGVLGNEEILGCTMYVHLVRDTTYFGRVLDFHSYTTVSEELLSHCAHPVSPERVAFSQLLSILAAECSQVAEGEQLVPSSSSSRLARPFQRVTLRRHQVHVDTTALIDRGSVLEQNVFLGPNCQVGRNCRISHAVLGSSCVIGDNVHLNGAYLWNNVSVGSDSRIFRSIITSNVVLASGSNVSDEFVLNSQLTIKNSRLASAERSSGGRQWYEPSMVELEEMMVELRRQAGLTKATELLSENSHYQQLVVPLLWRQPVDAAVLACLFPALQLQSLDDVDSEQPDSDESDDDETVSQGQHNQDYGQHDSTALDGKAASDPASAVNRPLPDPSHLQMCEDIMETLEQSFDERLGIHNTVIELNRIKHDCRVNIRPFNVSIVHSLVGLSVLKAPSGANQVGTQLQRFKEMATYFHPLLLKYIHQDVSVDFLKGLEQSFNDEKLRPALLNKARPLMSYIHFAYDKDIVSEDTILDWFPMVPEGDFKNQVEPFVRWLQEASEESD